MDYSPRNHQLIHTEHEPRHRITAELYCKWYSLFEVSAEGEVKALEYHALDAFTPKGESTYVDHVPNPIAVEMYSEHAGIHLDSIFFEALNGRWYLEVIKQ